MAAVLVKVRMCEACGESLSIKQGYFVMPTVDKCIQMT